MGMFDSFKIKGKCPYSNIETEFEFQTKAFSCVLDEFRIGDKANFNVEETILSIINGSFDNFEGMCSCKECLKWEKENCEWRRGFGRKVIADIVIENNRIKGLSNLKGAD